MPSAEQRASVSRGRDGGQVLSRGLAILQLLVEARGPLTATEIAAAMGIHQTSASRVLATLGREGYVRKAGYRAFVPDYGVLALAQRALGAFPLADKPKEAVAATAAQCEGYLVVLATLWRGHVFYMLAMEHGRPPALLAVDTMPLHLSSLGLRLLLELPEQEALAELRSSRERFGWERPTKRVPRDEAEALARAREMVRHDTLVLDRWQGPQTLSAAIRVEAPDEGLVALAISGPSGRVPEGTALLWLQEGRRRVEQALHA